MGRKRSKKCDIALRLQDIKQNPLGPAVPLDDIVVKDVEMFRAEDMGDHWWIACYLSKGDRITWHVSKKTGQWFVQEAPPTNKVRYEHELGH